MSYATLFVTDGRTQKKKRYRILAHTLVAKGVTQITDIVTKAAPKASIEASQQANSSSKAETQAPKKPVTEPVTTQPKKPTTKPISKNVGMGLGVSLKNLLQNGIAEKKEKEEATAATGAANDHFSAHQLQGLWEEYAEKLKGQQKINLHNTMRNRKPELKDNYTIYLPLESLSQSQELEKEKAELLSFLRRSLNNFSIQIDSPVLEAQETKLLYTPKDKFEHMVKVNPALAELRRMLDLDYH